MEHREGRLIGAQGIELYYQGWLPARPPRAIVLICTGVADHSGRYRDVADHLVVAGYAVYAYDHRGHGRSAGKRLHVECFRYYADDLKIFRDLVATWHPDRPICLLAHSMGSAIALLYLLDHPTDVAGLISSGTALYAGEGFPPFMLRLNRLLARIAPYLRLTSIPTKGISRDLDWVATTRRDPLIYHGPGTTRLGTEILDALDGLRPRLSQIALPLLIVQGEKDILTDGRGSRFLYKQASSGDKTLKVYAGAYHEVFNDLPASREAILEDIVFWLDAHWATSPRP